MKICHLTWKLNLRTFCDSCYGWVVDRDGKALYRFNWDLAKNLLTFDYADILYYNGSEPSPGAADFIKHMAICDILKNPDLHRSPSFKNIAISLGYGNAL